MLKKTITYTNLFTEQEMTEDHYFHISKADLIEMELTQQGGMKVYIERIIASEDGKAIITIFKKFLKLSYGKKLGDQFIKTEEAWNEFYSSEAYSTLFSELCLDAEKAAAFMQGIIPNNLEQEAAAMVAAVETSKGSTADPTGLTTEITPRILTQTEVAAMDSDELKSGIATGRYKLA